MIYLSISLISCNYEIDIEYIKEREWIDDRGRMIGFHNKIYFISNDTIYNFKKEPRYIIKSVNKYFNFLKLKDIETNKVYEFTSTEEYSK
ncbi:hypothetical protein GFJ94_05815 [Flavobacterium sp. LMO8]|uniref:hypothetical protein n=1 Tax=Flavobacterium sp. LMO8 TaxID=2654244 RepID=UPI0012918190|nr:hypothetical protein [Flavobacterium sp. LMO8]MQP24575.1 hypothetical protein [Flavobacterium sp. LMO8]